jgi:hypothetical protein
MVRRKKKPKNKQGQQKKAKRKLFTGKQAGHRPHPPSLQG